MKLHYRVIGEGTPLFILHGLFGYSDNWQTHARKLAEYYQVILVDQRNHGHSDWSDSFSYDLLASDLHELFVDLGIQKAHLLGHSMGGKTVLRFAQLFPNMVDKLIVVDMGLKAYPMHHQQILAGLDEVSASSMTSRSEAENILEQYVPEFGTRQFLLKNLYWIEKGKLAWRMNIPVLEREMPEILKALPEQQILCQTLFIRGELSGYIHDDDFSAIEDLVPDSTFVTIAGAGHWVHAEKPEEFILAVLEFLLR
jgi:pimeloyl-ACP methyl ester carboxylesterase